MSSEIKHFYVFGDFRFDSGKRILWRDGDVVPLTPRAADVLFALIERRGDVLERSELLDKVWKDTFVEEGNLSYTVSNLRKILGKNGSNGYIQTVPRRGYRFAAEVRDDFEDFDSEILIERSTISQTQIDEIHISDGPVTEPAIGSSRRRSKATRTFVYAVVVAAFAVAGAVVWRSIGAANSTDKISSLAVLPFRTIDGKPEDHLGLGIADMLIARLSGARGLTVRPITEVSRFEQKEIDTVSVGNELDVDAVLEGSIFRTNDAMRLTARIVRVSDNATVWNSVLVKPLKDQIALENEIALEVSNFLSQTASKKATPTSHDAYQLYVKGRNEWNKRDPRGLAEAQKLFRQAIDLDPNFALAHVGLADTLVMEADSMELQQLLGRALEIDPNLGEAYATRGFARAVHHWNWQGAEDDLKKAIELSPGYATAHQWYAILLGIEGRPSEAKSEMLKALEIDPMSYNFLADLCQVYYFERDYETAKDYCGKALEVNPNFLFAHENLEAVYWQTGEYEKALDELVMAQNIQLRTTNQMANVEERLAKNFAEIKDPYYRGGMRGFVESYIATSERDTRSSRNGNVAYGYAWLRALNGETEKALDNLELAFQQRAFMSAWIKADPVFDGLRNEPRYQAILKKMGLS